MKSYLNHAKIIALAPAEITIVRIFCHSFFVLSDGQSAKKVQAGGKQPIRFINPNKSYRYTHTLAPNKTLETLLNQLGQTYGSFYSPKTAFQKAPFFHGTITKRDLYKLLWQLPFHKHALSDMAQDDLYPLVSSRFMSKANPFKANICSEFVHRFMFSAHLLDTLKTETSPPNWMQELNALLIHVTDKLDTFYTKTISNWTNAMAQFIARNKNPIASLISATKMPNQQRILRKIENQKFKSLQDLVDAITIPDQNTIFDRFKSDFSKLVSNHYDEIIQHFQETQHHGLVKKPKPFTVLRQFASK